MDHIVIGTCRPSKRWGSNYFRFLNLERESDPGPRIPMSPSSGELQPVMDYHSSNEFARMC